LTKVRRVSSRSSWPFLVLYSSRSHVWWTVLGRTETWRRSSCRWRKTQTAAPSYSK
ncbi:hypothetical protein M9458_023711, partial [Cirrhinus mrigala]